LSQPEKSASQTARHQKSLEADKKQRFHREDFSLPPSASSKGKNKFSQLTARTMLWGIILLHFIK